eukprot:GHVR01084605.1.p1 GENE.GHVR01084605.1~~GHVR01084605.1.p1  ORF type:complete len:590 (-),score=73.31 GHVR01084605.1:24-1628(-)
MAGRLTAHKLKFFKSSVNCWDMLVFVLCLTWTILPYPDMPFVLLRLPVYIICPDRLLQSLRYEVCSNKRRYQQGDYDLDLTYITDCVIAMSVPASGTAEIYRNPITEVARFFNDRYPGRYRLVNLCIECAYSTAPFKDCVWRFATRDHNVPTLRMLLYFCVLAQLHLQKSEHNIIAINCKGGKGRTGLFIGAWLIWSRAVKTAEAALQHFAERRTDPDIPGKLQIVGNPCQVRFLKYWQELVYSRKMVVVASPTKLNVKWVCVTGLPKQMITRGELLFTLRAKDAKFSSPIRVDEFPLCSTTVIPTFFEMSVDDDKDKMITVDSRTTGTISKADEVYQPRSSGTGCLLYNLMYLASDAAQPEETTEEEMLEDDDTWKDEEIGEMNDSEAEKPLVESIGTSEVDKTGGLKWTIGEKAQVCEDVYFELHWSELGKSCKGSIVGKINDLIQGCNDTNSADIDEENEERTTVLTVTLHSDFLKSTPLALSVPEDSGSQMSVGEEFTVTLSGERELDIQVKRKHFDLRGVSVSLCCERI